jgi:hypothetical protein
MKNIHILQTEKPSRLFKFANQLHLDTIPKDYYKKYNISIINLEEIKKGDWFIMSGFILRKCDYVDNYMIIDTTQGKHFFSVCKKIILTTDQDLIADGVQAIDDEFLEWFVKNPSCEEVEIYEVGGKLFAEPIIPKEEPKQEICDNCNNHVCCCIIKEQRMYSKEEVLKLVEDFEIHLGSVKVENMLTFKKWFEQFKNK